MAPAVQEQAVRFGVAPAPAGQMPYELVLMFPDGSRQTWSAHRTYAEADEAGFELLGRWFGPEGYLIRERPPQR